ncbi:MAG: S1 RNA-binding domain-containing protein [Candidatus Pacebacteria bacterium]|nr:S1 RNA-binding domain-containing protein [Candidatus Paceibacterota bacterium]
MEDLLEKNNLLQKKSSLQQEIQIKPPRVGEIIEGKIIGLKRAAVYVDLGPIGAGIIYGREFYNAKDILKNLKIGDDIFVKVIDLENEEGYIELSLSQAGQELSWEKLRQKKETGELIPVKITGANKGGLLAEISGISAFLPVSQLSAQNYPRVEGGDTNKILKELQKFIGTEMELKIFDLDAREGKLILSEKAKETEKIKEILKNYKVGDIVEGEITGLVDFGAFMKFPARNASGTDDAGGRENLEGLIHISELDWSIVSDPAEIVKVGEKIKAKIIEIKDDRVSLSLKSLKKDPWQDVETDYKKGSRISGKVTKFNPFGAFVQITPKIQGLCHISEFGTRTKMEEILKIGDTYEFEILEIQPVEHRMSLKLVEKKEKEEKK